MGCSCLFWDRGDAVLSWRGGLDVHGASHRCGPGMARQTRRESTMDFYAVLDQILALLRQRGRVSYRALKRQFDLDDAYLDDLKMELIEVQQCARDQEGTMLVWTGEAASGATPEPVQAPAPLAYTPPYLAEKILTSRNALEGERK